MTYLNRILIDLDGVLVNFQEAAMELHGITTEKGYPCGVYDIKEACKQIDPRFNKTDSEFWDVMDHDWWASLNPTCGCYRIVDLAARLVGPDNVFIATSPTLSPDCASGKVAWIQKYLPALSRQFFIGPRKHVFAQPGVLLIDDHESNCYQFEDNNGLSILVPRPWNPRYAYANIWLDITLEEMTRYAP